MCTADIRAGGVEYVKNQDYLNLELNVIAFQVQIKAIEFLLRLLEKYRSLKMNKVKLVGVTEGFKWMRQAEGLYL